MNDSCILSGGRLTDWAGEMSWLVMSDVCMLLFAKTLSMVSLPFCSCLTPLLVPALYFLSVGLTAPLREVDGGLYRLLSHTHLLADKNSSVLCYI